METTLKPTPELIADHHIKQEAPEDLPQQCPYPNAKEPGLLYEERLISMNIKTEVKSEEESCFTDVSYSGINKPFVSNIDHDKVHESIACKSTVPGSSAWSFDNVKQDLEDVTPSTTASWDLSSPCLDKFKMEFEEHESSILEQGNDHETGDHELSNCQDTRHNSPLTNSHDLKVTPTTTYQHENPQNGVHIYKCARCPLQCFNKSSLIRHIHLNHNANAKKYHCTQCHYVSKSKQHLLRHWKAQHDADADIYECAECDYKTKTKNSLSRHVLVYHDDKARQYHCGECRYITKFEVNLKLHMARMHERNAKTYTCARCNAAFTSKRSLANHLKVQHDLIGEEYRCGECEYSSKIQEQFMRHWKRVHDANAKVYNCEHCDYASKYKESFQKHVLVNHDANAEVYKCSECDYSSKVKRNLSRHVLLHHTADVKVYKCEECGYVARYKRYFKRHVQIYHDSNAEVYKCGQCNYISKHKARFQVHVKRKHSAKVYTCSVCGDTFKVKGKLRKHIQLTHGANSKLYKCAECVYFCKDKHQLEIHTQLNHDAGDTVYKCVCDFTSQIRRDFFKHVRKTHCNVKGKSKPETLVKLVHRKNLGYSCEDRPETSRTDCSEAKQDASAEISNNKHQEVYYTSGVLGDFSDQADTHDEHKCPQCNYKSKGRDDLCQHVEVIHQNVEYSCKDRPETSRTDGSEAKQDASAGISNNKAQEVLYDYQCRECGYTSAFKRLFVRHWNSRHAGNANVHQRTLCNNTSQHNANVDTHIELKHKANTKFMIQLYKCAKCDYMTRVLDDFSHHVNRHREHNDPQCNCVSEVRDDLCRDIKVEHQNIEYSCEDPPETSTRDCPEAKHDVSSSIVHKCQNVGLAAKLKLYKCANCEYTSQAVSAVKEHMTAKHNTSAKEYKCMECDFTTKSKELFVVHWSVAHEA